MGEATYYLKAYCDSDEHAEMVAEELKLLFAELDQIYYLNWRDVKLAAEELRKQYPHAANFLATIDAMHKFPDVGFAEGTLDVGGSMLYYYSLVSHLADWEPLAEYMQKKWGCKVTTGFQTSTSIPLICFNCDAAIRKSGLFGLILIYQPHGSTTQRKPTL